MFESSVIVANESLSYPQCEKMDLNHTVIFGKGSNTQKCWKAIVGSRGCKLLNSIIYINSTIFFFTRQHKLNINENF